MLQCRSRRWCGGSWAKKEFASSRSIGRIDSPRERILKTRRRHGRGEETVGYRVPWRGTKFEISSGGLPRAANFSFNSLPHKESRLPDPKGEKSRKRLESRCRAGQSSRNQLPRGGEGSFGRFGITSSPISTLPNPRAPRLIFIHVEPCLSKVISRSVNVSNVYNPYALHFVTRIGKNFLYHGN